MKCYPDEGREKKEKYKAIGGKRKRQTDVLKEREREIQTDRETYISKKKRERRKEEFLGYS